MPIAFFTSLPRLRGASGSHTGPKSPKEKKSTKLAFLKRIFSSSGATVLPVEELAKHDVHIEMENDIPDNIVPALAKAHQKHPKKDSAEGNDRAYHETAVNEFQYVAGDFTGLLRKGTQIYADAAHSKSHAKSATKQANVEGMTQAISLLTGYVASMRGHDEAKQSYHIGDKHGIFAGTTSVIRGPFEMLSGGGTAVTSGISTFASPAKAASLARTVQGISIASSVGSGAFFILLGAPAVYSLYESGSTYHNLKKHVKEGGDAQGFTYLKSRLEVKDTDREKILDELFTDKEENAAVKSVKRFFNWIYGYNSAKADEVKASIKGLLSNDALTNKELKKALNKLDPNGELQGMLSDADLDYAEKYIASSDKLKGLTPEARENLIRISAVFYKAGLNVVNARKEKQLCRMIGSKACEEVKANLHKDVKDIDETVLKETINSAKKGLIKSLAINTAIVVGCLLGFVGTIMGAVLSGGVYPLIATIISIVTLSIWTGLDSYTLYEEHKAGNSTKKDKVLMVLSTIFMVSITIIGNLLTAGVVSMAVTGVLTAGWMFLLLYSVYTWREKEKKKRKAAEETEANRQHQNLANEHELAMLGVTQMRSEKIRKGEEDGYNLRSRNGG
ncbi:MAG: hypothetical protein S4CHLAM37_06700 [Chlamydiia bacterium]|nr:hypothetical protein [Chlamydiia bacterium]